MLEERALTPDQQTFTPLVAACKARGDWAQLKKDCVDEYDSHIDRHSGTPGSLPEIYTKPLIERCCPASGPSGDTPHGDWDWGSPGSPGSPSKPNPKCVVAQATMKAAEDSRVMGAPMVDGPGLSGLAWNLDVC